MDELFHRDSAFPKTNVVNTLGPVNTYFTHATEIDFIRHETRAALQSKPL